MPLTLSKSVTTRSEHELVAATRAGNDRAFEELYAQYRDRILAFIAAKIHDHGRAEDIAQDVFMAALRRLRQTDQPIHFKPWIYEIAKNAAIDEFRRGSRAREIPLETDGENVVDRQPSLTLVPTPPAAMESKQRLDDLRGAFGGLSENHHRLLVMRELHGMSYDEIGTELHMTKQMVESGLFRARRKLTEEYDDLASGRRCEQIQDAITAGEMRSAAALGIRERRRVSRHLAHCQPCRHHALVAGVDSSLITRRGIAAKIAALFPVPFGLLRWPGGGTARGGLRTTATSSHRLAAGAVPKAGTVAEQAVAAAPFGQAAAAVVALAIISGGAGLAHGSGQRSPAARPQTITPAAQTTAVAARSSAAVGGTGAPVPAGARAAWARAERAALTPAPSARRPAGVRAHAPAPAHPGASSAAAGNVTLRTPGQVPGTPTAVSTVQHVASGTAATIDNAVQSITDTGRTLAGSIVSHAGNAVSGAGQTVTSTLRSVSSGLDAATTAPGPLSPVTAPLGQATAPLSGAVAQVAAPVGSAVTQAAAPIAGLAHVAGKALLGH